MLAKNPSLSLNSSQWMDEHETSAKYNLAETCVASISVQELQDLSEEPSGQICDSSRKLDYGSIRGSEALRSNLARLYSARTTATLSPDNILITPGAIAANTDVFLALIREGDHVICQFPTYQQLYELPRSLGADVSVWRAREDDGWQLNIEELKELIRPDTKLIVIKSVAHSHIVHAWITSVPRQIHYSQIVPRLFYAVLDGSSHVVIGLAVTDDSC